MIPDPFASSARPPGTFATSPARISREPSTVNGGEGLTADRGVRPALVCVRALVCAVVCVGVELGGWRCA